ncbi:unnamed protein product [Phytophthora fragariaefolia]|uniref:Unnamed protein product n=1 Tax=Phytophthora fragariaefolia TaxID=1490495 RepID=A0A9W6X1Z2_9STRA|nr:unnamed protein product [Phytophthora fragariaefolia]
MKLANGSIGAVVAFWTAEDDVVQVTTSNGVEEHMHSHPPDIVFVYLKDYSSHPFVASLPPGVAPICKRKETGIRVAIRNRLFSLVISQAPVVPAYSLTTEKCQGPTVHKMILAPLRHPTRRIPQRDKPPIPSPTTRWVD